MTRIRCGWSYHPLPEDPRRLGGEVLHRQHLRARRRPGGDLPHQEGVPLRPDDAQQIGRRGEQELASIADDEAPLGEDAGARRRRVLVNPPARRVRVGTVARLSFDESRVLGLGIVGHDHEGAQGGRGLPLGRLGKREQGEEGRQGRITM